MTDETRVEPRRLKIPPVKVCVKELQMKKYLLIRLSCIGGLVFEINDNREVELKISARTCELAIDIDVEL